MILFKVLKVVLLESSLLKYVPDRIDSISKYSATNLCYYNDENFFFLCARSDIPEANCEHQNKGEIKTVDIYFINRGWAF